MNNLVAYWRSRGGWGGVFFVFAAAAVVSSSADSLRIGSPTGEVQLEWATQRGVRWVELEGLARSLNIASHWDPVTRRQEYVYAGKGPVVFIAGSRQARLGERLCLLPVEPRREHGQFWAPWDWVVDQLLDYWSLSALEAPPAVEIPPAERPERISELIAEARLAQASAARAGRRVIVIDPAHGGEESGSVSLSNLKESEVAMAYAVSLARALRRADPALEIVLTRRGPQALPDEDRAALANRVAGDVLVSLHCGARRTRQPGAWIFHMSDAVDSRQALDLPSPPAGLALWRLSYLPHQERSRGLAQMFRSALASPGRPVPRVMPARLRLLATVNMPAVLVELGNLGDEEEVVRLSAESERESVAQAMAQAVVDFLCGEPAP
ncbi:N-acetylmuramoyl-L-alanine amidase [bacterium]|nr:N-acetylmuramoyl-L-alanine amidase [bacterium]